MPALNLPQHADKSLVPVNKLLVKSIYFAAKMTRTVILFMNSVTNQFLISSDCFQTSKSLGIENRVLWCLKKLRIPMQEKRKIRIIIL